MKPDGARIRLTPAASATRHSPARRLWHARCNATSDDEHAVSTDIAGPCRPSTYAMRPDTMLCAKPVPECGSRREYSSPRSWKCA